MVSWVKFCGLGLVSVRGKGWVREYRPLITEGYGQSVLGLFIFLKKTKGVNPKRPTLKKNIPHSVYNNNNNNICLKSNIQTSSVDYAPHSGLCWPSTLTACSVR